MTNPAQDAGIPANSAVGATVTPCAADKRNLVLIPRQKKNIFGPGDRVKDMIKSYPGSCPGSPLKALEYNFYQDLNQERTITAILTEEAWSPHGDARQATKSADISFELVTGAAADFKLSHTSRPGPEAEITIKALNFYKEDTLKDHQTVKVRAKSGDHIAELEFKVHRNEDVGIGLTGSNDDIPKALTEISKDFDVPLAEVLQRQTLLVRNKKDNPLVTSKGVMALQLLLNQVVARHKGAEADDFQWLDFDGRYGGDAAKVVKGFLARFSGAFNYATGKFNVAVDEDLISYIKAEYGSYSAGDVVDRALLVGKEPWPATAAETYQHADGLLDIYNAVVVRFMEQMQHHAEQYTSSFNTRWLHRPDLKPYEKGDTVDDELVVISNTLNVRETAGVINEDPVTSVTRGATLTYLNVQTTVAGQVWYKVKTAGDHEGWCSGKYVQKVTKDGDKSDKNLGNFGEAGVCYSMGGKDRPDAFAQRLTGNLPAPDDIRTWYQYKADAPNGQPGIDTADVTLPGNGCDCSGFVQNCITESKFPDGTRIVPATLVQRIEPVPATPSWPWTNCIGAKSFVGAYARQITYAEDKENRQWLDKADLITSPGHIVWVANRHAKTKHASNDRDFEVYNEYGGDSCAGADAPDDKFLRKAIKMKFRCWGIKLDGANHKMGRIYIWS